MVSAFMNQLFRMRNRIGGAQGTVAGNAMGLKWRGVDYKTPMLSGAAGVIRWTGTAVAVESAPQGTNLPSLALSVSMSAGTPTIQRRHNVASLTDNGVGDFTVVPVSALATSEPIMMSAASRFSGTAGGNALLVNRNFNRVQSTTAVQLWVSQADGTAVDADRWSVGVLDGVV
jgi:hypothetical protein